MNLSTSREALFGQLQSVTRVASTHTAVQALSGVQVHAGDGAVELRATDNQISLRVPREADVEREGTVVLPARLLLDVVRALPSSDVSLELRAAEQEECERRLSLLYKKLGRWEEAVALWQAIAARPDNRALFPLLELAKYHEHVTRDLASARLITERALLLLERHHARMGYGAVAAERAALTMRLARLEERAARMDAKTRRRGIMRGRASSEDLAGEA